MKRTLALLLAVAMCLGLLTACGSTNASSVDEAAVSAAAPAEESAQAEAPAPAPVEEESAAPDASVAEEATPEEPPADAVYGNYCMANPDLTPFPANDGTTISVWTTSNFSNVGLEGTGDVLVWQMLEEITGYDLVFTDVNPETASATFMLMAAANDFTDIVMSAITYYTGGGSAAIEEGMIIDFGEYIEDYIPNLQALMDADPSLVRDVSTDDGYIPGVFSVLDKANYNDTGYSIRQDLLDEIDMEVPETYDELYEVLKTLTNAGYGGLALGPSGVTIQNNLLSGFGVYGEYVAVWGANYPVYVDGDEVKYGHMEEGFKEYIQLMSDWYAEGLIYSDFVSVGPAMSTSTDLIFNNDVSVFYSEAANLPVTEASGKSITPDFAIAPMPTTLKEVGSTEYYVKYPSHTENSWSVAANTEVLYEVLELFNFMYSDEGSLICNYGKEGVTYQVNEDGSVRFTDLVLNHEMGLRSGMRIHVMMGGPFKAAVMRMIDAYEPLAYSASVDYWTPAPTDITGMPAGVSLTAEESSQVANILGDILTYAGTMITKYIMGDEPMENFDDFIATMESMNIQDAIDIYQDAYDRYLSK